MREKCFRIKEKLDNNQNLLLKILETNQNQKLLHKKENIQKTFHKSRNLRKNLFLKINKDPTIKEKEVYQLQRKAKVDKTKVNKKVDKRDQSLNKRIKVKLNLKEKNQLMVIGQNLPKKECKIKKVNKKIINLLNQQKEEDQNQLNQLKNMKDQSQSQNQNRLQSNLKLLLNLNRQPQQKMNNFQRREKL